MWNNLDRRSSGADIYSTCMTVAEYRALSPLRRWGHRAMRHPLMAQLLLPPLVFLLLYRVPFDTPRAWPRERTSVFVTDIGLAAVFTTLVLLLGAGPVALVQLPTMAIAAILGVWLFSVQHRFENAVWLAPGKLERHGGRRAVRQLAPAAAARAAMVQRQYRLSSHPPPDAAGAQLPAGRMPRRLRLPGSRHAIADTRAGFAGAYLCALG